MEEQGPVVVRVRKGKMRTTAAPQMNSLGGAGRRGNKVTSSRRLVVWQITIIVRRPHGCPNSCGVAGNTTKVFNLVVLRMRCGHSRRNVVVIDLIGKSVRLELRTSRAMRVGAWSAVEIVRPDGGTAIPRICFRGIIVRLGRWRVPVDRIGMKARQAAV